MSYKVKVKVPVEKKGLLGKKTVYEERIVKVDRKTYKQMQKKNNDRPYSIEELVLYDEIFDD